MLRSSCLYLTLILFFSSNIAFAQSDESKAKRNNCPESDSNCAEKVGVDKERKEQPPAAIDAANKSASLLLPKGVLVVEPSVEYAHSSALRVAAEGLIISPINLLGFFDITRVDRDIITAALSTRLGVGNRSEFGLRVPYAYRSDSTLSTPVGGGQEVYTESDSIGLGDIEVSGRYQLTNGENSWPFMVAGLRYKSRTGKDPFEIPLDNSGLSSDLPIGSGFHSLQPSLAFLHPSDPVVFFGSAGYTWNIERDVNSFYGTINPGDSINLNYGMGFSVNEKASFSLGYSHNTVFKTEQNNQSLPNSTVLQVGALNLGYGYRYNQKTTVTLNLSAGLTNDAPDISLSLRVPFTVGKIF